jgi:hypothetical protein
MLMRIAGITASNQLSTHPKLYDQTPSISRNDC